MDINLYEKLQRQEETSVKRKPSVKFLDGAVRKSLAFSLSKNNEVKILRYLNDAGAEADFVPKILESNEENQYFVMERVDGVSLQVILDNLEEIEGKDFSAIIKAVKTALDRLHAHGVLHRDLHGGNFMLQQSAEDTDIWKCIIIDFGNSQINDEWFCQKADMTEINYEIKSYLIRYMTEKKKAHFLEILEEVFKF